MQYSRCRAERYNYVKMIRALISSSSATCRGFLMSSCRSSCLVHSISDGSFNVLSSSPFSTVQSPSPSSSTSETPNTRLLDMFSPDNMNSPLISSSSSQGSGKAEKTGRRKESLQDSGLEHDVVQIILKAVANVSPMMKVQTIRSGTRVVVVPKVVMPGEQRSLAVRWIVNATHQRKESSPKSSMAECLAMELLLAYKKEGAARQKRDDLHKLALENKANVAGYQI